jgi:hypothetical protein
MTSPVFRDLDLIIFIVIFFCLFLHRLIFSSLFTVSYCERFSRLGFRVPIYSAQHKSFEFFNRSWATLYNDKVRKIRSHGLISDETEATHVKLLGIHVNLELKVRLSQGIDLENSNTAFIIHHISFMLTAHLGLSLLPGQLIILIPFEMSFDPLLNNLLDLLFHS